MRELLEYSYQNGEEMQQVCRRADEEVANKIRTQAESGRLKNFLKGVYESYGKSDIYAYRNIPSRIIPGTSIQQRSIGNKPPELIHDVELVTKPVGTKEASMPRGYLIPADLTFIVEKLKIHGLKVTELDKPIKVSGEEFVIDKLFHEGTRGYNMTRLHGEFCQSTEKEFPAGTYMVDLAQPLANVAFYCLEPEGSDGFVGWNIMDEYLKSIGVEERSIVYPVYKYFKIIE